MRLMKRHCLRQLRRTGLVEVAPCPPDVRTFEGTVEERAVRAHVRALEIFVSVQHSAGARFTAAETVAPYD